MTLAQLSKDLEERLWSAAQAASGRAYARYSNFHVGAALLTSDGEIVTGCNVENMSYGLTNCAERTAIFRAVAEGKLGPTASIRAIAVLNRDGHSCSPCGACRQVIYEFGRDAIVIFSRIEGERKQLPVSALLPECFEL